MESVQAKQKEITLSKCYLALSDKLPNCFVISYDSPQIADHYIAASSEQEEREWIDSIKENIEFPIFPSSSLIRFQPKNYSLKE